MPGVGSVLRRISNPFGSRGSVNGIPNSNKTAEDAYKRFMSTDYSQYENALAPRFPSDAPGAGPSSSEPAQVGTAFSDPGGSNQLQEAMFGEGDTPTVTPAPAPAPAPQTYPGFVNAQGGQVAADAAGPMGNFEYGNGGGMGSGMAGATKTDDGFSVGAPNVGLFSNSGGFRPQGPRKR